jgi:DNA-binding NtrC family response regulator
MDPPFAGAGAFTDTKPSKIGFFKATSDGTLFLDEIEVFPCVLRVSCSLPRRERVRRVRAVSAHSVDVKLVAATQAGEPP